VKALLLIGSLVVAAQVARADAPKQAQSVSKLPVSSRVFVLDKDAPTTDKTEQLTRSRPALKQKS
jgi:hypothetical protein